MREFYGQVRLERAQLQGVHSTRVVFNPSKVEIRVRVPMNAVCLYGGLLYMVAYNLRKVENRDGYPDPPVGITSAAIV